MTSPLDCDFDPESLGLPRYRSLLPIGGIAPTILKIKRSQKVYNNLMRDHGTKLAELKRRKGKDDEEQGRAAKRQRRA